MVRNYTDLESSFIGPFTFLGMNPLCPMKFLDCPDHQLEEREVFYNCQWGFIRQSIALNGRIVNLGNGVIYYKSYVFTHHVNIIHVL